MKKFAVLGLFIALSGCATTEPTEKPVFENEPNGFRGIAWGESSAKVNDLNSNNSGKSMLESLSGNNKADLSELLVTSYSVKKDKMTFGTAEMYSIDYFFYKDKFYYARLYYRDSTDTLQGKSWSQMHSSGTPPPKYYNAKHNVDYALKKAFGKPTKESNVFLQIVAKGAQEKEYSGDTTRIVSNCNNSATTCWLKFTSVEIAKDFKTDLDVLLKKRQNEVDKEKEKADKEKQAIKDKSDF